ncbi:MAG: ATP-binding protein, partial [Terriglobales bacterium]
QWAAPGETVLSQAYYLGRELLAAEVNLLEAVDLHHRVLAEMLAHEASDASSALIEAAGRLFNEALAGYEMLLRGYGEANAALRGMNERLETQVEQIAGALHDESGQLLAAVMIRLDQVIVRLPVDHRSELQEVRGLLDQVEVQLRRLAHELHPALLVDLGLRPALEFLADGVSARSGVAITLEGVLPPLPPQVELCFYRCVQECLNNAARHAHARNVRIQMQTEGGEFEICVGDDGQGFDPQAPPRPDQHRGMGLVGMRERLRGVNGELELQSRPGAGAQVRLRIPATPWGGGDVNSAPAGR